MKKGIMPCRPLCFGSLEVDLGKVWANAPLSVCKEGCKHRAACRLAHMRMKPRPVTLRDAFIKVLLEENTILTNSLWTKCIQYDRLVSGSEDYLEALGAL